ncbi:hypothetical protein Tco_0880889 [Tanacetum coccineum]
MNPQETQQVVAHDEKWVPSIERVKISYTNVRLETTVQQKEETFKVVIDAIKNFTCFKAFTITAEVPKILCSTSGILSRRLKTQNLMNSFWPTRSTLSMLKSLERFWKSVQELKVKNLLRLITGRSENQDVKLCHSPDSPKSSSITSSHNTSLSPTSEEQRQRFTREEDYRYPVADVDVSKESDSEPAKKRTASRRVVKKKVIISATNNIIPDPDVTLELGKSISLTEAAEEEAARQVHATHARIVTESVLHVLEAEVKELVSQKGFQMSQHLSLLPQMKEPIPMKKKRIKDDTDDDKSINLEMTDDEETDDEFVHGVEQVNNSEDEEMTNAEFEESGNGDEENTDVAKTDAGRTKEVKDDGKKVKLPLTSSSLSISLGFGYQFLKLSSDTYLVITVKDTTYAEINSLFPHTSTRNSFNITVTILPHQTTSPIPTPPITIESPTITTVVPKSGALTAIQLRVAKLEKDVSELKKIDLSVEALATLKSQVPNVVDEYIGSKLGDALQKTIQKHSANLIQKHYVKPTPKSSNI